MQILKWKLISFCCLFVCCFAFVQQTYTFEFTLHTSECIYAKREFRFFPRFVYGTAISLCVRHPLYIFPYCLSAVKCMLVAMHAHCTFERIDIDPKTFD